jgi:methionyl-tRNA formyltransferase
MRFLWKKLRKTMRIGPWGALNGLRLRGWYQDRESEDIVTLCKSLGVDIAESEFLNCEATRELFKQAKADLGLSLGNGYIGKSLFSIPQYGMVNIHMEILPQFQGAYSIIWPIFEGLAETGFTIHQVDSHIDTGDILYQEKHQIEFYPTLRETVQRNLMVLRESIPSAFSYMCENYLTLREKAVKQGNGRTYTTPTIWQFFRMLRNHKRIYAAGPRNRCTGLG